MMCCVISSAVAAASFTSTSICQYVVCGSRSQVFRLAVKGTCTLFLSFIEIKVWSMQKQY